MDSQLFSSSSARNPEHNTSALKGSYFLNFLNFFSMVFFSLYSKLKARGHKEARLAGRKIEKKNKKGGRKRKKIK